MPVDGLVAIGSFLGWLCFFFGRRLDGLSGLAGFVVAGRAEWVGFVGVGDSAGFVLTLVFGCGGVVVLGPAVEAVEAVEPAEAVEAAELAEAVEAAEAVVLLGVEMFESKPGVVEDSASEFEPMKRASSTPIPAIARARPRNRIRAREFGGGFAPAVGKEPELADIGIGKILVAGPCRASC